MSLADLAGETAADIATLDALVRINSGSAERRFWRTGHDVLARLRTFLDKVAHADSFPSDEYQNLTGAIKTLLAKRNTDAATKEQDSFANLLLEVHFSLLDLSEQNDKVLRIEKLATEQACFDFFRNLFGSLPSSGADRMNHLGTQQMTSAPTDVINTLFIDSTILAHLATLTTITNGSNIRAVADCLSTLKKALLDCLRHASDTVLKVYFETNLFAIIERLLIYYGVFAKEDVPLDEPHDEYFEGVVSSLTTHLCTFNDAHLGPYLPEILASFAPQRVLSDLLCKQATQPTSDADDDSEHSTVLQFLKVYEISLRQFRLANAESDLLRLILSRTPHAATSSTGLSLHALLYDQIMLLLEQEALDPPLFDNPLSFNDTVQIMKGSSAQSNEIFTAAAASFVKAARDQIWLAFETICSLDDPLGQSCSGTTDSRTEMLRKRLHTIMGTVLSRLEARVVSALQASVLALQETGTTIGSVAESVYAQISDTITLQGNNHRHRKKGRSESPICGYAITDNPELNSLLDGLISHTSHIYLHRAIVAEIDAFLQSKLFNIDGSDSHEDSLTFYARINDFWGKALLIMHSSLLVHIRFTIPPSESGSAKKGSALYGRVCSALLSDEWGSALQCLFLYNVLTIGSRVVSCLLTSPDNSHSNHSSILLLYDLLKHHVDSIGEWIGRSGLLAEQFKALDSEASKGLRHRSGKRIVLSNVSDTIDSIHHRIMLFSEALKLFCIHKKEKHSTALSIAGHSQNFVSALATLCQTACEEVLKSIILLGSCTSYDDRECIVEVLSQAIERCAKPFESYIRSSGVYELIEASTVVIMHVMAAPSPWCRGLASVLSDSPVPVALLALELSLERLRRARHVYLTEFFASIRDLVEGSNNLDPYSEIPFTKLFSGGELSALLKNCFELDDRVTKEELGELTAQVKIEHTVPSGLLLRVLARK